MRKGWKRGLRVGAGLALGSLLLAVSFGAFAVTHGWPAALTILMSAVVFSGSGQFTLVTALAGGGGLGPALTGAFLMNLRFVPMGAATAAHLPGGPLRRAVLGQTLVDGSWVAAQRADGGFDRDVMYAATLVQWPAWVLGTAIGAILVPGTSVIRASGLDLVYPAFFGLLLYDAVRERPRLLPVAVAGGAAAAFACRILPGGAALLIASAAAVLALHPSLQLIPHKSTDSPAPGIPAPPPAAPSAAPPTPDSLPPAPTSPACASSASASPPPAPPAPTSPSCAARASALCPPVEE